MEILMKNARNAACDAGKKRCPTPFLILVLLLFIPVNGCRGSKDYPGITKKNIPKREERITLAGSRPIPYKLNRKYEYIFKTDKGDVGHGYFTFEKSDDGGFRLASSVDLNDTNGGILIKGDSTLVLDKDFCPISYERTSYYEYKDNSNSNGTEKAKASFADGKMKLEVSSPQDIKSEQFEIEFPSGVFIFDNNFLGQMAFICSQPVLKAGRSEILKVASVNQHAMITVRITPKLKVELKYKDGKIIAYEVDMKADDSTFGRYFITPDGVLLKAEEMGGMMLIELANPDV
jgi:hypothetical protein